MGQRWRLARPPRPELGYAKTPTPPEPAIPWTPEAYRPPGLVLPAPTTPGPGLEPTASPRTAPKPREEKLLPYTPIPDTLAPITPSTSCASPVTAAGYVFAATPVPPACFA